MAGDKLATRDKLTGADAAGPGDDRVELRRRLDRRLSELKLERSAIEPDWLDITRYLLPDRGRYMASCTTRRSKAVSTKILDPCGTKAHGRLAAFCMAGITNPAVPWFHVGIAEDDVADDDDVRAYLSECTRRMARVLAAGNFYNAMHQLYEEICGFATAVMIVLPDFEDVLRFHPLTAGEYWLGLDARQEVNELHREYALNVSQLVEEFGYDNVSPDAQRLYDQGQMSSQRVVVHAIEPNRKRQPGVLGWRGRRWIGTYYERSASNTVLRIEGFDHRPFIAPRWNALSGEPYGTGPGHKALPDIKSLQAGVAQLQEAAEKLLNPPLQGDARHQNLYVGMLPGDINWITNLDGQQHSGLRPIFTVPPNVGPLSEEVKAYRETVQATFYNDLIMAISQMEGVQPRNEMEIAERRTEKMLMLGPMLERFYNEALSPVIRLVFTRMQATGLLPDAPQKLRARQIEPKFVSVLAQAQKSIGTTGLEALLRFAGAMAATWPGVVQKIDADKAVEEYAEFLDVPAKVVIPQADVDKARAAAAAQQQQQQAAEMAKNLAGGAQTLSQTDIGGGQNALAAMMGR